MLIFALKRLLLLIPVLFGVVTLVFFSLQLVPGDPALVVAGQDAPKEVVESIRKELGLDQPVYVQYGRFLGRMAKLDLGRSIRTRRPVAAEIRRTLPNTGELVLVAVLVSSAAGVALGVVAATHRGTWIDKVTMIGALSGLSFPPFWRGLMLLLLFSLWLPLFPAGGRAGPIWTIDGLMSVTLPALALAMGPLGSLARLTRSSMLEVFGADYVRTARAKGLSERLVIYKHALRNALFPIVTLTGLQIGFFLGGSVVTETIFGWPGIGRLALTGITTKDFPIVQGTVLVTATVYVVINALVDQLYGLLDPRIRYS